MRKDAQMKFENRIGCADKYGNRCRVKKVGRRGTFHFFHHDARITVRVFVSGEGPFRAGYESVPGNSPELAQPMSGEITALSDHSSSVGRPVHARLPVPVAVTGSWSGLVYRARVVQQCAARSPV
jgi:hypothetical protein